MKKSLLFLKSIELPTNRDAAEYLFEFSLIDESLIGLPEERSCTTNHSIRVSITGRMQAAWRGKQKNIDFHKVCFEYGKRELMLRVKNGTISSSNELNITSSKYPDVCPFESNRIHCEAGSRETIEVTNN